MFDPEDLRCGVTDPSHPNTLYNYGVLLDSVFKKYEEAADLYERAIQVRQRIEVGHVFAVNST